MSTIASGRRSAPFLLGLHAQRLTMPRAPQSPDASIEVRILRAWISAAEENTDPRAVLAAVETVIRQEQARLQGKLSEAARLVPAALQPLFAQSGDEAIRSVIGGYEGDGAWRAGASGMTEAEREAYWLWLHGWKPKAIAREMTPRGQRRFADTMPVETVYQYLWRARAKLRRLFALAPLVDDSSLE